MAESTRILIADDHPIFRDGLRKLLEAQPDFAVVGEAGDAREAVRRTALLSPDVLLLDLGMPGQTGLDVLRELAARSPGTRVLLLTAGIDKSQIVRALELGARGVILKGSATDVLFRGIRGVMAGQCWVGRDVVSDLVEAMRRNGGKPRSNFGLTGREREIIAAVVSARSNKEIADLFHISDKTVKHHLTNIFDKLGVSNRLELALFAVDHGLTEGLPDSPLPIR
jgi:two-component system nitrate/nitrite response regulator NarL